MPNRRKLLLAAGLSSCALPCVQAARQPKQPHVVVIGAGGAGLAAAAEAARCGALVTVLEKQNAVGGDTLISGGFYAAVDPKRQIPQGISDSIERFTADILESGGDKSDPRLAQILARGAGAMLEQLESLGMRFQPDVIEIYGAHWAALSQAHDAERCWVHSSTSFRSLKTRCSNPYKLSGDGLNPQPRRKRFCCPIHISQEDL